MYADARTGTASPELTLIHSTPREREPGVERLTLRPTPRLHAFLDQAAGAGLGPDQAVELAIERALALHDSHRLAPDVETARDRLNQAAAAARPHHALTSEQAAYVRRLAIRRPIDGRAVDQPLRVKVADRLLVRARATLTTAALRADAVDEMVAWEAAAALDGRTMGEWALYTLALARRD